jgi:hypothetical protein
MPMDLPRLKTVFAVCGVGWMFDEDAEARANQVLIEMHQLDRYYFEKFKRPLDPPISELILSDTTRFKPLVQSFASPMSDAIRTMIYCVLEGAQVMSIRFSYEFRRSVQLDIAVGFPGAEQVSFSSTNLWDVEAIRHFGLMKMGNAPVIDGYYAFRKD